MTDKRKGLFHAILRVMSVALLTLICAPSLYSQSDVQLTQYWALQPYYNAGASGTTDYLRIRGAGKLQWIGIDNAPQNFLVVADSPLKVGKKRIGLGMNAMQESIGLFSNLLFNLQASYKLKLFKGDLSIGFQGGYFNQKFKGSEVETPSGDDYHEATDEAIPTQDLTGSTFDFSAGIFYSKPNFWLGVSGLHLLEPKVKLTLQGSENTETQEYETLLGRMVYFMGGCNFGIKNTLLEVQPSMLVKTDFSTYTAEVSLRARYNKIFSFGLGYRWKDAVSTMIGAEIKNFFLGYAYDYPLSAIGKVSSGSHEVIAGYQMKLDFSGKNRNKHRSIRIM